MNKDIIAGNWKEIKGYVKERWGKLTDDDLDTIAGKREQMVGKLQKAYGYRQDEAEEEIEKFEGEHRASNAGTDEDTDEFEDENEETEEDTDESEKKPKDSRGGCNCS